MKKESKKIILFSSLIVIVLCSVLFYLKINFEETFITKLISIVLIAFIVPFFYGIFRELIDYNSEKYDNKILKKIKSHIDKYFKN